MCRQAWPYLWLCIVFYISYLEMNNWLCVSVRVDLSTKENTWINTHITQCFLMGERNRNGVTERKMVKEAFKKSDFSVLTLNSLEIYKDSFNIFLV